MGTDALCADAGEGTNILSAQVIRVSGIGAAAKCPHPLRRIAVRDASRGRRIVLLTNRPGLGATTIAAIYKDRWETELFFKALKQNLKVKTFIGATENALRIQIWTAPIATPPEVPGPRQMELALPGLGRPIP